MYCFFYTCLTNKHIKKLHFRWWIHVLFKTTIKLFKPTTVSCHAAFTQDTVGLHIVRFSSTVLLRSIMSGQMFGSVWATQLFTLSRCSREERTAGCHFLACVNNRKSPTLVKRVKKKSQSTKIVLGLAQNKLEIHFTVLLFLTHSVCLKFYWLRPGHTICNAQPNKSE